MADKFGRSYILTIEQIGGANLVINFNNSPFTIEFDITRNVLTSANVCSVRIFNLSADHRNSIRKNKYDGTELRNITLAAGYGTNLPIIFSGNVTQCWSTRENVDFITNIECFDGGFALANAAVNMQFTTGTPQAAIIQAILAQLPNVAPGVIGNYPGTLSRGNAYSGSPVDILSEITGGGFYIDNGKAHCLNDNECLLGEIQTITASSGLLGTPVLEETYLNFDIVFEPRIVVGQQLGLIAVTEAAYNGSYKVISLKHRGMISPAVCGAVITSVGLDITKALTVVGAA